MVQWLGFLAFTEAAGVRFPVSELMRRWFSGIIAACHAADPGSIPGLRIFLDVLRIQNVMGDVSVLFSFEI
ncbi:hypothetical protein AYI70_g231 [Smittium culicis]|uniref:Uncharacterized protein n=1 Tax=Smittium culicis TaxID=133412 RepID=A0A1R1YHH3_9FUNG|nr:hypothetical protein AYI70_g231 [Smittium culicis]